MQTFHRTPQLYPPLRSAESRAKDFNEIYQRYDASQAASQAERCLQCGVPFCSVHCPLHNNIPDWLRYSAEGDIHAAYLASSATNNFPEICGRVCPQDRLCEGNCVVEHGFGSLTIGAIEKYITDTAWEKGWVHPFTPTRELPLSVGIIGSGPAGMAAAEQLRRHGVQVHMYDRYDRAGGMMMYGIPNFKLDKDIVARRAEQYQQSGIHFHLGVDIGRTTSFQEIRARHDAVLIATGVYQARPLNAQGDTLQGIIPALPYLTESTRQLLGDTASPLNATGQHVVVIGGGDTAMDCVRTAIRQGAASVRCVYRRTQENMPGSAREVRYAQEEGVQFEWLSAPLRFLGNERVEAVEVQAMQLINTQHGRQDVEPIHGDTRIIPATMVLMALGYDAEPLAHLFNEPTLATTPRGTLYTNTSAMTSLDGVFAAGDIVRGASLVVWAIADGREAAHHILRHLEL